MACKQKVEWAVTQYRTCDTRNMTEASWCIYTLICPLTGPATNHCPENELGHLWIAEHPNVHLISLQLTIHYACEYWLIATEPYDRIPTLWMLLSRLCRWPTIGDCEMLTSPNTLQVLLTRFASMTRSKVLESSYLTLPDYRGFCNPGKISWTIWLLYCDKLSHQLSCNKCF